MTVAPSATEICPQGPMAPRRYRIAWRRELRADTTTLGLAPLDEPIHHPHPGQFTMLWAPGVGEIPISLSGIPAEHDEPLLEQTVRAVGAASAALADATVGSVVGVRGPFGTGWDLDAASGRDVVVIAGGLGLAPLRPLIHAVLDERDRFGRVEVIVGARSPEALVFVDDLESWSARADVGCRVTVDTAGVGWRGDVGVVTRLLGRLSWSWTGVTAFVCGPEPMMRFAGAALHERGVDPDVVQLSLERSMRCGVGHCGHCQLGGVLLCTEGPVVRLARVADLLTVRER